MTPASDDALRMRALLLELLRDALRYDATNASRIIPVLCPVPATAAWLHSAEVRGAKMGAWYLWRMTAPRLCEPDVLDGHADQAIVEGGQIVGKWGCGLDYYPVCAPLALPDDVRAVLREFGQEGEG